MSKSPLTYRKALRIAKEYFPDFKGLRGVNKFLGYVLWEYTGWPSFWHGDPEECLRKQLKAYADDSLGVQREQESAMRELSQKTKPK